MIAKPIQLRLSSRIEENGGETSFEEQEYAGFLEDSDAGEIFLTYKESMDDALEDTTVSLHLRLDGITYFREGAYQVNLHYRPGEMCQTHYQTPYGALPMALYTTEAAWEATKEGGQMTLAYEMHVQGECCSKHRLQIVWSMRGDV